MMSLFTNALALWRRKKEIRSVIKFHALSGETPTDFLPALLLMISETFLPSGVNGAEVH